MNSFTKLFALAVATLAAVATAGARAEIVNVELRGSVEWNQITGAPLNGALLGQNATLSFSVDSTNFQNNPQFPTRGYIIDQSSFKLAFPTFSVGLQNPYPANSTPFFVIRNNDPAVDGFFISEGTGFFDGVPLNQTGGFGQFANEFHVTYEGTRLPSLNIMDALGHYDFTGLSVFNWTIDDGPFNALGILFNDMTISAVPEPASAGLLILPSAMIFFRRRK